MKQLLNYALRIRRSANTSYDPTCSNLDLDRHRNHHRNLCDRVKPERRRHADPISSLTAPASPVFSCAAIVTLQFAGKRLPARVWA